VDSENGNYAFKAIETLMQELPGIHTTCGLSNISFGLPERFLFNRTFMIIAMSKGLDSAIIDPLDKKMMTAIYTANAMLGKDFFCGDFLDAMRAGKIQN
jgi:5-methyltetrahydrofolate--homocysteine methyltransferase